MLAIPLLMELVVPTLLLSAMTTTSVLPRLAFLPQDACSPPLLAFLPTPATILLAFPLLVVLSLQ
jgi:hypothetical protein